ncbi:hypothetical protein ACIRL2_45795 [Embleya sp. NPDC127516]|uniref:hypothetical protein n=1 Tax=Embleya sp. NPDC127516 TaxID=3363990 RepID=UPI00380ABD7E
MFKHAIDRARDRAGRVGTLAGTAALTAGMCDPGTVAYGAPAVACTAGVAVAASLRPWRESVQAEITTVYLTPTALLLAEMAAFRLIPGVHWGEAVAAAVWTGLTWWARPARTALFMIDIPPTGGEAEPASTALELAATPEEILVAWWAAAVSREGGAAPGTHLEYPQVDGPKDFEAEIVADERGMPVPDIPVARISALTDIPMHLITVGPVPGCGAGRKHITAGAVRRARDDINTRWERHVASKAMPGSVITDIRYGSTKTPDNPTAGEIAS